MQELTWVFVIADTAEDAHRLGTIFTGSRGFAVTGFGVTATQLDVIDADVVVVRTTGQKLGLIAFPSGVPILLLTRREAVNHRDVNGPSILSLDSTPAQIRAAAAALAAGLHIVQMPGNREPAAEDGPFESLTDRELEVLNLVAEGFTNREIAKRLGVSRNTVKFHVSSIIGKLGATSRTEAVTLSLRRGLIIV